MEIIDGIREEIRTCGVSQAAVARAACLSPAQLSRGLAGKGELSLAALARVAGVLGLYLELAKPNPKEPLRAEIVEHFEPDLYVTKFPRSEVLAVWLHSGFKWTIPQRGNYPCWFFFATSTKPEVRTRATQAKISTVSDLPDPNSVGLRDATEADRCALLAGHFPFVVSKHRWRRGTAAYPLTFLIPVEKWK